MANNKEEQECLELHRTIWGIANNPRGSVDGWDFKQYVLCMLFYRYISENLTQYINQSEYAAGQTYFDYAKISGSEDGFKGLFDDLDVNSNKLGGELARRNEKLVKLMNGVDGIKLGDYKDKAINTSIQLRSKKELINNFISSITSSTKVDDDWRTFVKEQKEQTQLPSLKMKNSKYSLKKIPWIGLMCVNICS